MSSTAIVILNWNGKAFLEAFLSPLAEASKLPEVEVFIADNGSTDDSLFFLKKHFPQLRTIILGQNWGYTGGYNRALAQVEADYYVLLNSDVLVEPGWIEPLISFMDRHPQAGICMPKLRAFAQPHHFEYAGAAGGFLDHYGYPFCRGRILSNIEADSGQYDTPVEVFWASGACFMIRAELYKTLGGLDDRFFAHMEEIDLCWRAKLQGWQVWAVPQSQIFHVGGGTLPNNSPRKLYLNYRNNLFMLYKNLPQRKLLTTLLMRILLDYLSCLLYFLQGRPSFSLAVLKAHHHFWHRRKKFSRQSAQQASPQQHAACAKTIYPHSIVLRFFLSRRKLTFNTIAPWS